jgi:adenine-specific DNA-methyltransferase
MAADNFQKLKRLLEELFQLDQADLDFGIYRIMNQKRDEVVRFLDQDLLPQVKEAFGEYKSADTAEIRKELDKLVASVSAAGMNPNDSPKVQELREKLATEGVDVTALENDVYSHLFSFFRRYYSEGDFISMRRYKEGVYAIPYEGEEVKLHWSNHDQYYIKSSEYLRDYVFKLSSGKRVRVHLVSASTEQDNKKEAPGKERRFVLADEDPLYEENGELYIRFEYRPDDGKKKQAELNQAAIEAIIERGSSAEFRDWINELAKPAPTGKNSERTILERHLNRYTARNTFDYFIHKDLGGFLRRELDFYIKNEVMHLDDIEHDSVPRVEQYLSKIKVIRKIAHKIIRFLEQLENFQKKLWLKKKFVVETNYCITLDRVPEDLYPEIAANDAQREEWVKLFAIDEIEGDLGRPGYSEPLSDAFLKSNPNLVVDTRFFNENLTRALLASLDDIESEQSGTLVHSENFQAMKLAVAKFRGMVQCIYVDPPYNTGKDDFIYKDNYQHSCWLSFIIDRLRMCHELLGNRGALFCSIDDNEAKNLEEICGMIFGAEQLLAPFFIQVRYANKTLSEDNDFQRTIERLFFYAKDKYSFKPIKDKTDYPLEKFQWEITEKSSGEPFLAGGKKCFVFKPDEYEIKKLQPSLKGLKETWATGSLLRQKGSSGEFFGKYLAPRKQADGLCCLYKVEGIGEDGIGYRYFTGPQRESATKGKFFSGIPLQTLEKIQAGDATKDVPIHNFYDFAGDFGNCRQEGRVDILGGKKPEKLLERVVSLTSKKGIDDLVLDPFSGSGTSPSVAHKLGKRFLAIEQGDYFDSKVMVRMKYTLNGTSGGITDSPSGMFKYIRLESYEDALNNLELQRTPGQTDLLSQEDDLREQYVLSYMLDVESRGSQSLLNVESFRNPDEYKLKVERNGETQLVNVDLVETFNWLLGLTIKHIDHIRGVRVVEGISPDGERVLVLWRNLDETDNDALDAWFKKQGYNTKDQDYDAIYVNGDNNLENLRRTDQTWKVRLTEEHFHRLMFEDCDS